MEETRIRAENELLKIILNHSFGNVFVIDKEGQIVYVNETAAEAIGVPQQELLHMSAGDLVHRNLASKVAALTVLKTKKESIQSVQLNSGIMAVYAKPVFDEAGELEYVVVFSQQQRVVEQFMKSVQLENQIISQTLSHIIQNSQSENALIAESETIKRCLATAQRAAQRDSTVMLYGESGAGKEVVARFVHQRSPREKKLFMPVNCAAIPHTLMESEFFGYEKGAFTGSGRDGKMGLFELADGGTLFMDEIGELDLAMQSKLLRVLETGEMMRVGGTKVKKVDVRIVAATNRDLKQMVENKDFREDLFYRLNVIPITVPPLRERKEDTAALALYFMDKLNRKYSMHKTLTQGAIEVFQAYAWPGNVRELRNVVERIFVIVQEDVITGQQAMDILGWHHFEHTPVMTGGYHLSQAESLQAATEAFQRDYITEALKRHKGNVKQAAQEMKMGCSGLYKKLDKLGIKTKREW